VVVAVNCGLPRVACASLLRDRVLVRTSSWTSTGPLAVSILPIAGDA